MALSERPEKLADKYPQDSALKPSLQRPAIEAAVTGERLAGRMPHDGEMKKSENRCSESDFFPLPR